MPPYHTIGYTVADGIACIRLNRPDRLNAINGTMYRELIDAARQASRDAAVRAVLLTGTGNRAFCAGADLSRDDRDRVTDAAEVRRRHLHPEETVGAQFWAIEKPVVAAVNGAAVGGGLGLALTADIIVAADTASFSTAHVKLAMPLLDLLGYLLPPRVGPGRAADLAFTGRTVMAAEALAMGLVDRVVPARELHAAAWEVATSIAHQAPLALRFTKQAIRRSRSEDVRAYLPFERYVLAVCFQSEDAKEAVRAAREGRPPVYQGC